jgi:hypothetical protein
MKRFPVVSMIGLSLALLLNAGCQSERREFSPGADPASTRDGGQDHPAQGGDAGPASNTGGSSGGNGSTGGSSGSDGSTGGGEGGDGPVQDGGSTDGGSSLLALGQGCEQDEECDSRHCANDVCCDSACDGVCEDCSSAGTCDEMPSHDVSCLPVTCPADTVCRDYEGGTLTTDLCGEFGECKGQDDCAHTNEPDRTFCGSALLCESGECVNRTVECGTNSDCETFCCERIDLNTRASGVCIRHITTLPLACSFFKNVWINERAWYVTEITDGHIHF